jgi:hypothetical protein
LGKAPKYSFCIHGQPMCSKCSESADFGESYVREWADYWRKRALSAEDKLAVERERVRLLELAEEGAKEAFCVVVQKKRDLEKEVQRLTDLLAGAHRTIREYACGQRLPTPNCPDPRGSEPNAVLNGKT